uniref:Proteophosphoglycan PPG1 n=1 Tax=Toxoplasma gondii COUG TaxID=1074873 RepID=A0A2G8XVI8_TOXGO|nr:proteophosphoglycan PPG1 [Toxoplasma gondii COUG]
MRQSLPPGVSLPFVRISEGLYLHEGETVKVRLVNGILMAHTPEGWISLRAFLQKSSFLSRLRGVSPASGHGKVCLRFSLSLLLCVTNKLETHSSQSSTAESKKGVPTRSGILWMSICSSDYAKQAAAARSIGFKFLSPPDSQRLLVTRS